MHMHISRQLVVLVVLQKSVQYGYGCITIQHLGYSMQYVIVCSKYIVFLSGSSVISTTQKR